MVSRGMLTLCAAINSVHWLLTCSLRKKNYFCIHCENRGGYREADERYKSPYELVSLLPSPMPVHPGLSPTWAETPKSCFLASGLNNDLFLHICVNEGANQLRGNSTARAADQRFCFYFTGSIPLCTRS